MLASVLLTLMIIVFLVPIMLLLSYFKKAEKMKKEHDKQWADLYHEIKDDKEALDLYKKLSLLR